jgi:hypothetical protein
MVDEALITLIETGSFWDFGVPVVKSSHSPHLSETGSLRSSADRGDRNKQYQLVERAANLHFVRMKGDVAP